MIGSHTGLGRGLGITTSAIDAVPAVGIARQKKDPKPPCCGSLYFHEAACARVHPEIAALPSKLPLSPIVIDVVPEGIVVCIPSCRISPDELRAVARQMLVRANQYERLSGGGNG